MLTNITEWILSSLIYTNIFTFGDLNANIGPVKLLSNILNVEFRITIDFISGTQIMGF